jgi:hypothetical protein
MLKVYLEADCRIIADRLAGRLTAQEAAQRAQEVEWFRMAGKGPDGRWPVASPAPTADAAAIGAPTNGSPTATPDHAVPRRRRGQRGPGRETRQRHAKVISEWESGRYASQRQLAWALGLSPSAVRLILQAAQKKSPA